MTAREHVLYVAKRLEDLADAPAEHGDFALLEAEQVVRMRVGHRDLTEGGYWRYHGPVGWLTQTNGMVRGISVAGARHLREGLIGWGGAASAVLGRGPSKLAVPLRVVSMLDVHDLHVFNGWTQDAIDAIAWRTGDFLYDRKTGAVFSRDGLGFTQVGSHSGGGDAYLVNVTKHFIGSSAARSMDGQERIVFDGERACRLLPGKADEMLRVTVHTSEEKTVPRLFAVDNGCQGNALPRMTEGDLVIAQQSLDVYALHDGALRYLGAASWERQDAPVRMVFSTTGRPIELVPHGVAWDGMLSAYAIVDGLRQSVPVVDMRFIGPSQFVDVTTSPPKFEQQYIDPNDRITEETITMTKSLEFPSRLDIAKEDISEAALRSGARQFLKLTKEPIVALLQRHLGPDDESMRAKIAAFLDTEAGSALHGAILAMGLMAVPEALTASDYTNPLARELRVAAMASAGDMLADVIMEPLRKLIATSLAAAPQIKVAPSIEAPKEPSHAHVDSSATIKVVK